MKSPKPKTPSFRQGLPESSPQGGESVGMNDILLIFKIALHGFWIPAIHAGMTALGFLIPATRAGMTNI